MGNLHCMEENWGPEYRDLYLDVLQRDSHRNKSRQGSSQSDKGSPLGTVCDNGTLHSSRSQSSDCSNDTTERKAAYSMYATAATKPKTKSKPQKMKQPKQQQQQQQQQQPNQQKVMTDLNHHAEYRKKVHSRLGQRNADRRRELRELAKELKVNVNMNKNDADASSNSNSNSNNKGRPKEAKHPRCS